MLQIMMSRRNVRRLAPSSKKYKHPLNTIIALIVALLTSHDFTDLKTSFIALNNSIVGNRADRCTYLQL